MAFFDVERIRVRWDEEAVHSLQGGHSHDFKLESSLKLYPGQTLRFPLPSLTMGSEVVPGGTIDFVVSVSTFPKPDYQNRITLPVEGEYPADGLTTVVDHQETGRPPIRFTLSPNYPNSFNGDTVIHFALPTSEDVELFNLAAYCAGLPARDGPALVQLGNPRVPRIRAGAGQLLVVPRLQR